MSRIARAERSSPVRTCPRTTRKAIHGLRRPRFAEGGGAAAVLEAQSSRNTDPPTVRRSATRMPSLIEPEITTSSSQIALS